MPAFNVTVQQYTPLIRYAPSNAWRPGTPADPQYSQYNDGFRLTTANGSNATFDFHGTGVWIYGAYRLNHGNFSVNLDGAPQGIYNGSANDQFQVVVFGARGLENTNHSVGLTNIPINADHLYVDIDFITYEVQLDEKSIENPVQVDVSSTNWTSDSSWSLEKDSTQGALLTSITSGAKTTLVFQGESVDVYGSIGPLNSQFDVSVDGNASTTFDCYYDESRSSVLLWSTNSLGDGPHKLEITNRPKNTSQNKLELDYALVRSANQERASISTSAPLITASVGNNPAENTVFKGNTGAIIGVVLAAVVLLVVVATAAFHWQRKRRLVDRPTSAYIPPMSSNSSILPTTRPAVGGGLQGSHPKHDPPARATTANPVIYGNTLPGKFLTIGNASFSSDPNLPTALGSGSQLSASTAASPNVIPIPPPVSSHPPDSRAVHRPRERSAHLATPETRTQPLSPHPPTEPRTSRSSHGQTTTTLQSPPTTTYTSSPHSSGSAGGQSSYAYQPHPQSIFGDQDDTPDHSEPRREAASPPPDYWTIR